MIKFVKDIEELKKEISEINNSIDIGSLLNIDLPFFETQEDFTVISIHSYNKNFPNNLIFISKENVIIYALEENFKIEKKFLKILKKKYGESTVYIFLLLKLIMKNYSQEFFCIRSVMDNLDLDPVLDSIEEIGRDLRKLTDRIEGLIQVIIELKEEEITSFNVPLIDFDYDLLNAESRYWLERCRSHVYRIASLRTKSEMRSNRELNDTMKKLTVIMTFLTIVSIVVNVPGTIGAIFGIPALSDAYFNSHTNLLIITLIITTLLSVVLGYVYWRYLGLKR